LAAPATETKEKRNPMRDFDPRRPLFIKKVYLYDLSPEHRTAEAVRSDTPKNNPFRLFGPVVETWKRAIGS